MKLLDDPTKSLEIVLAAAIASAEPSWCADWAEPFAAPFAVGAADGATAGTTPVTVVPAPSAGRARQLKSFALVWTDSSANVLTVRLNSGGSLRPVLVVTLAPGDTLQYEDRTGFQVLDSSGRLRTSADLGAAGAPSYTAQNKDTAAAAPGNAVAVHSSGSGFLLAVALAGTVPCAGLAVDATAPTFAGRVQTEGPFRLADWTAATGAALLAPLATYFLDPTAPGGLTMTPPTGAGQFVQALGLAVAPDTLDLRPSSPILL